VQNQKGAPQCPRGGFYVIDLWLVRRQRRPEKRRDQARLRQDFVQHFQALRNQPMTVFGNGSQTRSFCYVSDLIEGIYRLMMSSYAGPVNIGNPAEMTVKQFAEEIIRTTGARSKIVYKPLPQDDPKQRQPDITRARKLLKWEPQVPLRKGLQWTIDWFRGKV